MSKLWKLKRDVFVLALFPFTYKKTELDTDCSQP